MTQFVLVRTGTSAVLGEMSGRIPPVGAFVDLGNLTIRESDGPLKKEKALEYGRVTYALAFSFALVVGALR